MTIIIASILIGIFLSISGIHIYWGLGGQWGNGSVIPTKDDNVKVIMPGVVPTFTVAFGLLGFGFVVFINVFTFDFKFPLWFNIFHNYGLWVIAGIFTLRAIGEFNYVGFFKKIKHTKFAQNDTKFYSPLCLVIGMLTLILELNK
ncbi:MAG: DUF3995 domain-containing protein [Leptospiraceae bacterium]|nr:DUF3995 domain-containing protein [Leptospiraceae bacterium]